MIKWIRKLFGPRKRVYVNDWYYWDRDWIRLDVTRMVNSERFKEMCRDIGKFHRPRNLCRHGVDMYGDDDCIACINEERDLM